MVKFGGNKETLVTGAVVGLGLAGVRLYIRAVTNVGIPEASKRMVGVMGNTTSILKQDGFAGKPASVIAKPGAINPAR